MFDEDAEEKKDYFVLPVEWFIGVTAWKFFRTAGGND